MLRPRAPSLWLPVPTGGAMASSTPVPEPNKPETRTEHVLHALYCSDPECAYCKDLQAAEKQWKRQREGQRNPDAA